MEWSTPAVMKHSSCEFLAAGPHISCNYMAEVVWLQVWDATMSTGMLMHFDNAMQLCKHSLFLKLKCALQGKQSIWSQLESPFLQYPGRECELHWPPSSTLWRSPHPRMLVWRKYSRNYSVFSRILLVNEARHILSKGQLFCLAWSKAWRRLFKVFLA